MNLTQNMTLILLVGIWPLLPSKANDELSLKKAREQGRLNSRILNEGKSEHPKSISSNANSLTGEQSQPTANLASYRESIQPLLKKHCLACHGPEKSEGRLRVDLLDPDLIAGKNLGQWREIYQAVGNSEMPPDDDSDFVLTEEDRGKVVNWLSAELNKASVKRRNQVQHSSFRRMTNYEFDYALRDLLGVDYPLADRLPPESASEDGFKNQSDLLQMSAPQFETFREIGLNALKRVTVGENRIKPVVYRLSMQDEWNQLSKRNRSKMFKVTDSKGSRNREHLFDQTSGMGIQYSPRTMKPLDDTNLDPPPPASPVVLVLSPSQGLKLNLDRFLPDEGTMRVSIRASRSNDKPDEFASLRLNFSAHTSNNANFSNVISKRDLPVTAMRNQPQVIHFDIQLGDIQRNPFRKLATRFPRRDEFLTIQNISNASKRAGSVKVFIDHIEISAPFYKQWPPKSHTDIFFQSESLKSDLSVEKDHRDKNRDERLVGKKILKRFMTQAWRRPVTPQEVEQYLTLFQKYRPEFDTFESAMLEVLATVLAAPEFLYVTHRTAASDQSNSSVSNKHRAIDDWELASRLSFFLWSSIPDEELLSLAHNRKLKDPETLADQVRRMISDPRSKRFSENFTRQWLGLDGIDNVTHVSDHSLKAAMQQEPIALFEEVLTENRSILDFIHSDYVLVNERLARHYRVNGVYGPHFRKVDVDLKTNRGGILTNAALMAINSDGKDSHPLKRGVWLLERILQDPPPPPPPNVPEVDLTDPNILKMTLKERIADHRNKPACYSCHSRIDPWGIAFENYDALGIYRTRIGNKPVDATSKLFNQQELGGIEGLKRYLLTTRQDQFARAMVRKLSAYALGRPLTFSDHSAIEELTSRFRKKGDRLGDLIELLVTSEFFQSK